ncbi:MAG: hypothetical protein FVQ82_02170 [Planctomycetes bacterium]|nr:hypothetical protein [Planctomycetota bacterium]
MNIKSKSLVVFSAVLLFFCGIVSAAQQPTRVLIYSGANNHKWSETTPAIKKILTDAAISVDVIDKPADVTAKLLSKYDVIVSNWNNFRDKSLVWSDETRKAYLNFISKGGGHVMVHAGGSSFYDWPEYHKIVASWGKGTNHSRKHEFPVTIEIPDHPICRGLKPFKTKDELWRNTKFPASGKILMTGFSSKKSGGKDNKEPILTVSNYDSGRCVNFMLGHDAATMTNPGFKTVLVRSVLWAADKKQSDNLQWKKTDKSIALKNNGKTVWQFNYGKETSKPFFHPVALLDGTVLTEDRPADHPWHHALWFTWKYINGVNFWEENRKTGESNGKTDWSNVKVTTQSDNSAKITMNLTYSHKDQKPILSEKRTMVVSPADENGVYYIDWTSKFTACSETDVKLDRTPIPGDPGGKGWGGYAGLSVRLNGKGEKWEVTTEKEPIKFDSGTFRGKANSMEFSGVFSGKPAGIAILDHPKNLNAPTPWYAIAGKPMKYFSPAVICYKPHTIPSGKTLELKYRVIIHPKKWNPENLKSQIKKYKAASKQPK